MCPSNMLNSYTKKNKKKTLRPETLPKFRLNASVFFRAKVTLEKTEARMETEAFSRNIGKVPNLKVGIRELSFPESSSASLLVA